MIEQVGSFDAMPNNKNEKLVALNFKRIQYWLSQGAGLSDPVAQVFLFHEIIVNLFFINLP